MNACMYEQICVILVLSRHLVIPPKLRFVYWCTRKFYAGKHIHVRPLCLYIDMCVQPLLLYVCSHVYTITRACRCSKVCTQTQENNVKNVRQTV